MKFSIPALYDWYRQTIRNPKYRWWVAIGTLIYLLSPIDIAPDFIPIVGQIDDFVLLSLLVTEMSQIVLEGYKARRQTNDIDSPTANEQTPAQATVDVEAVETSETKTASI